MNRGVIPWENASKGRHIQRGPERQAASTNIMSRFETEVLTRKKTWRGWPD